MAELILINKPYKVLSQFTDSSGRETLARYVEQPGFYPAGRLDYDSEGLLLLCDDGRLQQRIADPHFKLWKTYLLQVEGSITSTAIAALSDGVTLKDGVTRPARVEGIAAPTLWERVPPIRQRERLPTSWIKISIREGRNRQLRRMCAAVGYPVLRLVRIAIGDWQVAGLAPGEFRQLSVHLPAKSPNGHRRRRPTRR